MSQSKSSREPLPRPTASKTEASSNQISLEQADKLSSEAEKKVDYKLPFLLSQYFSREAGHLLDSEKTQTSLRDTDERSVFYQLQDKLAESEPFMTHASLQNSAQTLIASEGSKDAPGFSQPRKQRAKEKIVK